MDKNTPKATVTKKEDPLEKQELKTGQIASDDESGQGTASNEKSSTSVSQSSDSTSGIEVKYDAAEEEPRVPDSKLKPENDTNSPKKSPRKSPIRKVQEGLSWVKRNLSPRKSEGRERSISPKVCRSPKKSPQKSPKKSPLRRKLKSQTTHEKIYSPDEVEPFLLRDQLRYSSSSNEEHRTEAERQGAIPKIRHQKHKSKEHDPEVAVDNPSGQVTKSVTKKFVEAFRKSPSKKMTPVKTKKKNDNLQKEKQQAVPFSRQVSREEDNLRWSEVRITTDDEDYTASPSEIDLSSMSSYKFAEFPVSSPDQIERDASSVAERLADVLVPEVLVQDDSSEAKMVDIIDSASLDLMDQTGSRRQVQSERIENKELENQPKSSPGPKKSPKSHDKDKSRKREGK